MDPRASWLHRLGAGPKLAVLAGAGTGLVLLRDPVGLGLALLLVLVVAGTAGFGWRGLGAALRPLAVLLGALVVTQALLSGWAEAWITFARVATLVLLAALVTATTPASGMTAALERGARPLRRLGLRPRAVALTLSLALRFLPLLADRAAQAREAQRARGLERRPLALAVPLLVQALKMGHEMAEAIEARGFDPERDD